jgi:peptide deformylase
MTMPYVRPILTDEHPTLRKVAKRVERDELRDPIFVQLIDDMFETMYHAPGIGLAAPQVDVSKRLVVIDVPEEKGERGPLVLINPQIVETEGEVESVEGCLSVPGMIGDVTRFERVVCVALDRRGRKITLDGTGLFGRCLQHEIDHLDGVLYTDKARNIRPAATPEEHAELAAVDAEGAALERNREATATRPSEREAALSA